MSYTPSFAPDAFRRNYHHYYLPNDDGKRVFYTYIRKNACSAFKDAMRQRLGISALKIDELAEFRAPSDPVTCDHTLFVYRDPFERTVSAYVNKFVQRRAEKDIFSNYAAVTGRDPSSATFREFVAYIQQEPFGRLDPHVWPQKAHLASIAYSDPVPMAELGHWIARTLPSLTPFFKRPVNSSRIQAGQSPDLCETPADKLALATVPLRRDGFMALRPLLADVYADDIEMIAELTHPKAGPQQWS